MRTLYISFAHDRLTGGSSDTSPIPLTRTLESRLIYLISQTSQRMIRSSRSRLVSQKGGEHTGRTWRKSCSWCKKARGMSLISDGWSSNCSRRQRFLRVVPAPD